MLANGGEYQQEDLLRYVTTSNLFIAINFSDHHGVPYSATYLPEVASNEGKLKSFSNKAG